MKSGRQLMTVSILQLMGFLPRKPVHSRAGEKTRAAPPKAGKKERITGGEEVRVGNRTPIGEQHPQASSARRQDVKAKPGKAKAPAKTAKKLVSKARPAASAKTAAKGAAKASAKKIAVKKAPAKPVAKAATKKPAAKPAAKPVKAPAKAKPTVKAPIKTKTSTVKSAAKPTAKAAPKAAAKGKVVVTKAAKAPEHNKAPVKAKAPSPVAVSKKQPVASPAVAAKPAEAVAAKVPRPSARLAALTVPSMAQSVASTAAKSSYSQTMSTPVIIPPAATAVKKDPKLANNWKTKPVEQLTDAEMLAMPDSEYMNDKQLAFFRLKLALLKQDILNSAGETTEHLREDTVIVPDPADRATIEEEHALELRTRDRERKLLKKIEQSIMRIDAGDYGYCDETGEPIGVGRLLARPTATLSLEAQQRRELKQKMFGD
jgi:DnaK suppressor protein